MRIALLSDLHFEFHADGGAEFIRSLDATGVDVLILAGDITSGATNTLGPALSQFAAKYPRVLFVHGNHELWKSSPARLRATVREVETRFPNLTWLDGRVAEIEGQRFLGTTLWFPKTLSGDLQANYWSDFKAIPDFKNWVYEENAKSRAFLRRECRAGDIVVTHYLPSYMSVHPTYAGAATNCFFVSDEEELIAEHRPRLWLHGHTHCSMRYTLNQTEVVCNPFGYAGYELNPNFEERFIWDVRKEKGPEP